MKHSLIIALFIQLCIPSMAQKKGKDLSPLKITQLCDDHFVFTTYNKYKDELVPANGMYIITKAGVVMIDTPWDTSQCQALLDSIQKRHNKKVVLCIATHYHADRTGGFDYYSKKGIKTYSSKLTFALCEEKKENKATYYFNKDTTFVVGDQKFQTYYPGPGHAPDNIVIWMGKEKILYGGCFIKSTESKDLGNLNDASIKDWEKGLVKVTNVFAKPKYVIPGHFDWKDISSIEHTQDLVKKELKKR